MKEEHNNGWIPCTDKLPEEEQDWYISINCERCEGTGKILDD